MSEYTVYSLMLENGHTLRLAAEMMEKSGQVLEDGRPFTLALYDTWDEQEQRAFVTAFLIQRWDSLTPAAQQAEVLQMPKECHKCGQVKPSMAPCASVAYTKLQCSDCALKVLTGETPTRDDTIKLVVWQHNDWAWDPRAGAPVRLHSLVGRADLNGKLGQLIQRDEASGRWGVRVVDSSRECVKMKRSNFTYHEPWSFRVPSDGSMRTRDLRDEVRSKVGAGYLPGQISLWRHGVRMDVDGFDADGVVYSTRLRDHGLGPGADLDTPRSRRLEVLISPQVHTAKGVDEQLDPDSDYSRRRQWPAGMAYEEKARRHVEMFGEDGHYEGPPYHPDVTPAADAGTMRRDRHAHVPGSRSG